MIFARKEIFQEMTYLDIWIQTQMALLLSMSLRTYSYNLTLRILLIKILEAYLMKLMKTIMETLNGMSSYFTLIKLKS